MNLTVEVSINIVEEYRNRIWKATNLDEKKAIAFELHQLADTFNNVQKAEYEESMKELRRDITHQLDAIDPISQRIEATLNRYKSAVKG